MLIWEKKIPSFLVKKDSIVKTTIFSGLFALAFINIYSPFRLEEFYHHPTEISVFIYSSLIILAGMAVIVLSRIIMYHFSKKRSLTYIQYSFWIFIEIVSMAAFYALFAKFYLNDIREFMELMVLTVKNTALILLLPYTVLWLYFSYSEKTKQLEEITQQTTPLPKEFADKMVPFYDDNGKLKISVLHDDILYLEASDNYVSIFYISNNKISKHMIRNTLKNLEKKLSQLNFIRCHRSYLVNLSKIKILKREKEGLYLELDSPDLNTLPVSKTYVNKVIETFSGANIA